MAYRSMQRRDEWLAALSALGVVGNTMDGGGHDSASWTRFREGNGWYEARYHDQALDVVPLLDLSKEVAAAIRLFDPDVIYTHWPFDLNQDHRCVAEAVLIATRPVAGSTVRRVLAGEVPESTSQAFGGQSFAPTVFVALGRAHVDAKLAALECYASERRERPHLRNRVAVEARTEYWGGVSGVHNAEAFVLLREVLR